jgi:uncharacterized membrane protein
MNDVPAAAAPRDPSRDRNLLHLMYALHGLAPFTAWLLAIIAVIIGAVKKDDVEGTYLASHVSWLSRTFWWGLLWVAACAVITLLLVITVIGLVVFWVPFTVLALWYFYRVIKGWLRLNDSRPVE